MRNFHYDEAIFAIPHLFQAVRYNVIQKSERFIMNKISQGISLVAFFMFSCTLFAQFKQPFTWKIKYDSSKQAVAVIANIPTGHYLYKAMTKVTASTGKQSLKSIQTPATTPHKDDSGTAEIYPQGKQTWLFKLKPGLDCVAKIEFQGCRDKTANLSAVCFMPSTLTLKYKARKRSSRNFSPKNTPLPSHSPSSSNEEDPFKNFEVLKTGGGFMPVDEFLKFLKLKTVSKAKGEKEKKSASALNLGKKGIIGLIIFILLGGLALNLTPCVLPMMPINLAIIGAGGMGISKKTGFIRGGVYGLGIALSYGILGLLAMFAGAKFGTLNASPWFNIGIAVIFVLLALGMFDIITIDLSRYGANIGFKSENGTALPAVFAMGVVSALLAGACVAPVVIAVLLYSMTKYAEGNTAAIFLPFLLGIGMALPWPIAGGGIASLPKPGKWMVRVKQLFGVFIIIMAGYYAWLGFSLLSTDTANSAKDSISKLKTALATSQAKHRPVFIDFWATWCKNCSQMEHSTFQDSSVKQTLEKFVVVKFQAEDPNQPNVKQILDKFKIIGLPGYVILRPKQ